MNYIKMTGKIASPIELRKSKKGIPVVDFTLLHKDHGKNPVWVDVEVWDEEAEKVHDNMTYDDFVQIEGELRRDKWTSKFNNEPRSKLKITAKHVNQLEVQEV